MFRLFQKARTLRTSFSTDEPFQQYDHHPNCSSITDDELAQTVHGVWPNSNGNATINYVFSLPAYWFLYANPWEYHLRNLDASIVTLFQNSVRFVIRKIQSANNGILNFQEIKRGLKTDYSPFFRGVFYAQTATEAQFTADDSGAFTYIQFDNNGYIKRAIVHLPTDYNIYNDSQNLYQPDWADYAICHESYHTLGQEHLQDFPDILAKLMATPDGVFCSVMDYPNLVGTNISSCFTNCTPQFAVLPGPLDVRSMQLAYLQNNFNHGYNKDSSYYYNAIELLLFFLFISFSYAIVYHALKPIFARENRFIAKKTLKNYIEVFLNIALLSLLIEMDSPNELTIVFGIATGFKLVPDSLLAKLACYRKGSCFAKLARYKYPLFLLGFAASFSEGVLALPIIFNLIFLSCSIAGGNLFGKAIMTVILILLEYAVLESSARMFPHTGEAQTENVELSAIELMDLQYSLSKRRSNEESLLSSPFYSLNHDPLRIDELESSRISVVVDEASEDEKQFEIAEDSYSTIVAPDSPMASSTSYDDVSESRKSSLSSEDEEDIELARNVTPPPEPEPEVAILSPRRRTTFQFYRPTAVSKEMLELQDKFLRRPKFYP